MTTIKITKEHIKWGRKLDCANCPGALAVNAVLKPGYYTHVGARVVGIYQRDPLGIVNYMAELNTPAVLLDFMRAYDRLGPGYATETSFELPIPPHFLKEAA